MKQQVVYRTLSTLFVWISSPGNRYFPELQPLVDKMVVTPIVASVKPGELVDVTEGEAAEEADDDDAEAPTGEVRGFGSPKSPSGVALAVASTVAVAVSVSIAAKTTEALTLDM